MVEYLQGAIRLDADYTNNFSVTVTNDEGYPVEGNMTMKIGDLIIKGDYDSSQGCYNFSVPANLFAGTQPYQFAMDGETLIFPQKIYFV